MLSGRAANLDNYQKTATLELESEATQLTAIFSTIIRNMRWRLEKENEKQKAARSRL